MGDQEQFDQWQSAEPEEQGQENLESNSHQLQNTQDNNNIVIISNNDSIEKNNTDISKEAENVASNQQVYQQKKCEQLYNEEVEKRINDNQNHNANGKKVSIVSNNKQITIVQQNKQEHYVINGCDKLGDIVHQNSNNKISIEQKDNNINGKQDENDKQDEFQWIQQVSQVSQNYQIMEKNQQKLDNNFMPETQNHQQNMVNKQSYNTNQQHITNNSNNDPIKQNNNKDDDEFGEYQYQTTQNSPSILPSPSSLNSQIPTEMNEKVIQLINKLPNYNFLRVNYFIDFEQ